MGKQIITPLTVKYKTSNDPLVWTEIPLIMDEEEWERVKEFLKNHPPHNFPVIMTDIHKWEWVAFSHPSPDKD